jgi:hypothetical protein
MRARSRGALRVDITKKGKKIGLLGKQHRSHTLNLRHKSNPRVLQVGNPWELLHNWCNFRKMRKESWQIRG